MIVNIFLTQRSLDSFYLLAVRLQQIIKVILIKRNKTIELSNRFFGLTAAPLYVDNALALDKNNTPFIISCYLVDFAILDYKCSERHALLEEEEQKENE